MENQNNEISKCLTTKEMFEIVSNLSDIDTALDIINLTKTKNIINIEIKNDKLWIKN